MGFQISSKFKIGKLPIHSLVNTKYIRYNTPMSSPFKFFTQVRDELAKVIWPTRQDIIRLTGQVIFVSILVGGIIGALDLSLTALERYIYL